MIESLLPHVSQFVRVRQALVDAEVPEHAFGDLNQFTRVGLISLDWRGRIVDESDRAADILCQGEALFDQGGSLRARSPKDNESLENFSLALCPSFAARPLVAR